MPRFSSCRFALSGLILSGLNQCFALRWTVRWVVLGVAFGVVVGGVAVPLSWRPESGAESWAIDPEDTADVDNPVFESEDKN